MGKPSLAAGLLAAATAVAGCGGGEHAGALRRSDALSVGTLTPGRSATDAPAAPPAKASAGDAAAATVPLRTSGRTSAGGAPGLK